jgi:hypothetical protein
MSRTLKFDWDVNKGEWTLIHRGFDFKFAASVFDDPRRIDQPDLRRDYGEDRRQTIGRIGDRVFFVVYTRRAEIIRIISARRAHDSEERFYQTPVGSLQPH